MSPSVRPEFAAQRNVRWSTFRHERAVLAVVHNVTAATRLFDTLPILAEDPRLRIAFTCTGSSAFDRGTVEFLEQRGVVCISWRDARRYSFDLALSASYGGKLHKIDAPLFVIPHGMGYNKFLNKETKKQRNKETKKQRNNSVFGLSAEWLTHDGELIPTAIILSHIEQRNRLITTLPAAASNIIVAGDICFDQLSASLPLRASYRRAYGLPSHRKLVVISSTWGEYSLLEKHPDLPRRIAESLPVDEFRIVLAPHPNIVAEHSSWQFGRYQAAATRAGVRVLDDVDEWKAAVLAADLIVGDHGSVPFYATAVGIPPLLATVAGHTVDPSSPIAGFLTAAPKLDHDGDLADQIRTAMAEHTPDRYTAITDLTTSQPGASATILRTAMYEAMRLPEPTIPAELCAVSLPAAPLPDTESHLVQVNSLRRGAADVVRYPAERLHTGTDLPRGAHLAVSVVEPRHRWLRLADIMIGLPGPNTADWIADTLLGLPGCCLATAPDESGRWLLGDGNALLSVTGSDEVCRLFASVAQRRISAGDALADLCGEWKINCGGVEHTVRASEVL